MEITLGFFQVLREKVNEFLPGGFKTSSLEFEVIFCLLIGKLFLNKRSISAISFLAEVHSSGRCPIVLTNNF